MLLTGRQDAGQGGGIHGDGFPFNFTIPPPHYPGPRRPNNTVSVTSYITVSSSIVSTLLTTSYLTTATTSSTTVTSTLPVTIIPTASLAAQESVLKSTAALTKTNTIIASVLGGFIILLIIALAIVLLLWIRHRRRERDDDSPPFTSLTANAPTQFVASTTQSAPQLPRQLQATSLSMGPRSAGFVPQSFISHPPNRSSFSRPFSAPGAPVVSGAPSPPPTLPRFQNLPAINIQPNTPSVSGRDDASPISPILQPSAARMPLYHEALQEEAENARNRAQAENAGRLGLPVIERAPGRRESIRASVSSIGSDMGFENGNGEEHREREGQPVLHSTRASSGVFPEP